MTSFPKPSTPLVLERHARKQARKATERTEKSAAKARDGHRCRWPHCQYAAVRQVLDAAHLAASGMGGDPATARMTRRNLVALCRLHHQGPESLHSGDLKIETITPEGADGPLLFYRRGADGAFYVVAEETGIGVFHRD